MFERYLQRVGMTTSDSRFLFRAIQKTKNGESLQESGKISYTCLCYLYLKKLESLGFPAQEFGLHSMRSGGATAAANANVPDHIFKRHGRWKSENAKDGHGLENQLEVSREIGLYLQCNTLFVALVYQQPTAVLAQPHWVREYMPCLNWSFLLCLIRIDIISPLTTKLVGVISTSSLNLRNAAYPRTHGCCKPRIRQRT